MGTREFAFSPKDITTVYDALRGYSAEQLACAMLRRPISCVAAEPQDVALGIATRRVASILRVLSLLGPNCEASSHIILPWRTSHLSQLSSMSWQDALGARIAIPADASYAVRSQFLANALLCMSCV